MYRAFAFSVIILSGFLLSSTSASGSSNVCEELSPKVDVTTRENHVIVAYNAVVCSQQLRKCDTEVMSCFNFCSHGQGPQVCSGLSGSDAEKECQACRNICQQQQDACKKAAVDCQ
jgi:hypothetical protein